MTDAPPSPTRDAGAGRIHYWPAHDPPSAADAIETECAHCSRQWRVHRDLGGYRLRCVCPGWIQIPFPRFLAEASATVARLVPPRSTGADPLAAMVEEFEASPTPAPVPRAPARTRREAPRHQPDVVVEPFEEPRAPTAREIDRGILDLVAIAIAFLVPPTVVHVWGGLEAVTRWLPLISLVSGLLVILVGLASGPVGFEGLRRARSRDYALAVLGAGVGVGLATGWLWFLTRAGMVEGVDWIGELRTTLGLPATLLAVVLCPAVFEEIAFRGLLQGRLVGLVGLQSGIILTTVLFALAHGVTAATPIHLVLGLALSLLRHRSGSLYPGMVLHGLYNAGIIALSLS